MSEYKLMTEAPLNDWTAIQLSEYLRSKGLGDYAELFLNNNVTGSVAHRLTEANLKEMGVSKVGDRLAIMQALETLRKAKKLQEREKVIWTGTEQLYFSRYDALCSTCCGCCPDDPAQYKLMTNHLEIKTQQPNRCGPCKFCWGHAYEIDNIDLSEIRDVDMQGVSPTCFNACCCCGAPQEHLRLTTGAEGEKVLRLKKGQGTDLQRKIKNQVEQMQVMERS